MPAKTPLTNADKQLAKQLSSEPRLFSRLADAHLRAGETKPAAKLLVKGLQDFPNSVAGWMVKGKMHLAMGQTKLARAAFEKVTLIDPDVPLAHRHAAELALDEGDVEGQIEHLQHIVRLEALDDNAQGMLQSAILRNAAVRSGIFQKEDVSRIMPGKLRQQLLLANALPQEIARRTERFTYLPGEGPDAGVVPQMVQPTESLREQPAREKLAWKDPAVEQEYRRSEEEREERYVRVSWADAVSDRSAAPLVEIGPEQFQPSEEEEKIQDRLPVEDSLPDDHEFLNVKVSKAPDLPPPPEPPTRQAEPEFVPMLTQPYIPQPKPAAAPEAPSPFAPLPVEEFASEWEGGTPALPGAEMESAPAPAATLQDEPPQPARRPRLTADIKLPEMRPLELDEAQKPSPEPPPPPPRKFVLEKPESAFRPLVEEQAESASVEEEFLPPPPVAAAPAVKRSLKIETALGSLGSEEPRGFETLPQPIPRDASPIERLFNAELDRQAEPSRPRIIPTETLAEPDEEPQEPEPTIDTNPAPIRKRALDARLSDRFRDEPAPATPPSPAPVPPVFAEEPPTPIIARRQPIIEAKPEPIPISVTTEREPAAVSEDLTENSEKSPDLRAREEAARQELSVIAEQVTGTPQAAVQTPTPATEAPPPESKLKGKIATKTLAELYASQGDWARAVEVYEALLEKFPTNEAYQRRLEGLKAKISDV